MRNQLLYLQDILAAIERIEEFVGSMSFDEFQADDKTTSAVIRKLEIIGEAAKGIPPEIRNNNRHIPWKEMAGMRDKLIHFYFGVDHRLVWSTIIGRLPEVKKMIEAINRRSKALTERWRGAKKSRHLHIVNDF